MILARAQATAASVRDALSPFCDRIAIAGSVRRECPEVGDIELVMIRRGRDLPAFVRRVDQWPAIKGKPSGLYTQRMHPSGINLDLFMATPQNWGLIYAIRTGSARFSHEVLAKGWVKAGFHSRGGLLHRTDDTTVTVPEEEDLFRLIGVRWIVPSERK